MIATLNIVAGPDFYQEVQDKGLRAYIKYLSEGYFHISQETDIVVRVDGVVAGVAGIWPNPFDDRVLWMPFLSVRPEFKKQGIGTALAHAAAEYARKKEKVLHVSSYSQEGLLYLKRVFDRLKQHPKYRITEE